MKNKFGRIYHHIQSSINLKITLIMGVCLVVFLSVLLAVNFFGMNELENKTLNSVDEELNKLVSEYYENYIDAIGVHIDSSMDDIFDELHILSNILQTFFSNRSDMDELIESLKESPYFEDRLENSGKYIQNKDNEPTSVFVASYMIEDGQPTEEATTLIDDTRILDLILPAFTDYGVNKIQAYFQGGENREVFRLSPWSNIGEDIVAVYPEIFDQPIWEAFNPGLASEWRQWLQESPEDINEMLRVTPPVQDGLTGDLVLTLSQPLANEGFTEFEGTISYDVPIGNIISMVEDVKISENGFAFVVQSNGNVFAINEKGIETFGLPNDTDSTVDSTVGFNRLERYLVDSPYSNVKNLKLNNTEQTVINTITIDQKKYLMASKKLLSYQSWNKEQSFYDETWQIGLIAPFDEVFKLYTEIEKDIKNEVFRINTNTIIIAGLLALVILFIVYKMNKIVTSELIDLASIVNTAKAQNYDISFKVDSHDEVGILAVAFEEMLAEIKSSFEKLENQNRTLKLEIDERKQRDRIIDYLENFDSGTDLPNKKALLNILKDITAEKEHFVSLVVIGLDEFRKVNEAYSWTFGDKLMQKIAERLRSYLPTESLLFKLSGDEFAFLIKEKKFKKLISIVEDVNGAFNTAFEVENHEITIGSSLGISSYPFDSEEPLDIFKFATNAMIHAKEVNKGNYEFYNEEINSTARMRMEMINELRSSIENDEFELFFQPIVNLNTLEVTGMEALLRWHNHNLGNISPNVFIPLAEKTKLILPIGDWVIREALNKTKQLHEKGYKLNVAINVSVIQFLENTFIEKLLKAVEDSGLPAEFITIEITEGLFINDMEKIMLVLSKLRDVGIAISVDDFGTGYSSLSYIKNLPLSKLKIDRSFIRELEADKSRKLVSGIIGLAQSLNLNIVAEGIETQSQLEYIQKKQCDEAQGYYFSKPVKFDHLLEFLKNKNLG